MRRRRRERRAAALLALAVVALVGCNPLKPSERLAERCGIVVVPGCWQVCPSQPVPVGEGVVQGRRVCD